MREHLHQFFQGLKDPGTIQGTVLWGLVAAVFYSIFTGGFTWEKGTFLVMLVGLHFGARTITPPPPPTAPA